MKNNFIYKKDIINCGPNSNILKAYKAQFTSLTQLQKEILIGILLGDGYIYSRNNNKTYAIKFEWSYKSKDYIFNVYNILYDYIISPPKIYKRINKNGNEIKTWRMETYNDKIFNELGFLFINNKRKTINNNLILNNLTNVSLAYWYMDDGGRAYYKNKRSLTDYTCILNTQSFTVEEVNILIYELNIKFNLNTKLSFNKKKPIIIIPNSSYNKFYNLINSYVLDIFKYKLPSIKEV